MPYTLRKTNGTTLAIIQDGTIETSTDLIFVGKNYAGYGQTVNENFLKLLENFAGPRIPANPLSGQLYFDTTSLKLKIFDGNRFKNLMVIEVDNKRPSDLRQGDQWFDPVDQKLYVYNGQDFIMIGPEKTATALQSQIAGIVVQDDTFSSYTVLQASVGSGSGSMTAIFSPNAFTPNANSSIATDQQFANVARGITLPGTSAVQGTKDPTVVGALPDSTNQWSFFGASGSSWGLLERDGLGGITFYDSKNYIRRDEFASFSGNLNINNAEGVTVGIGEVLKLHVAYGNDTGNLTNLQGSVLNFNLQTSNVITNALSIDYSAGTLSVIPNQSIYPGSPTDIPVDLGTDTKRFRAGYIKTLYTSQLNTSTTGIISGNWTLAPGSSIAISAGASVNASLADRALQANTLRSYDNTNYVEAKIDGTAFSIAQRTNAGRLVATGLEATLGGTSKFYGTWEVGIGGTVQASTLFGSGGVGYISASTTSTNNTIVQRTTTGGINASSITTPILNAGTLESSNGQISGQWTLIGTSTLEATYADIAERYAADNKYEPGMVLIIGGTHEVTTTTLHGDVRVAGVVSTKPAFKMNYAAGDDNTHPYIALKGRCPCMVTGVIKKGDRLVTAGLPKHAAAFRAGDDVGAIFAIALEDFSGESGVIEVMVK